MRFARVEYRGRPVLARVTEGGYELELEAGKPFEIESGQAKLLPPASPSKVLAIGWNFHEHIVEMVGRLRDDQVPQAPEEPIVFLKPPSAVVGHGDPIVYPRQATRVEYEGELVVVIGRRTRQASPEDVRAAVLGWTCGNDVTERDMQKKDKQWWRAKGFDTFAPVGPWLETELPPPGAWLRTWVNGEIRQEGRIGQMIRNPYEIISYVSHVMTLLPGDMIMLGTPPGVGEMRPGDEVEISIDGIGSLHNKVVAE